ncbi:MAG: protein-export chaperone SecB [Pseudomonadota bacterium]|nr:protein-export chaperone SecB [Pseudomonadota bacterium]MEE3100185.1 protein-export chaperone SecB [Pseudomonadota bacterium]
MSDSAQAQPQPQISILSQYVRDLSFENVAAQAQVSSQEKPDIKVSVNLDAQPRGEDRYEVRLKLSATSTAGGATMFVAELDYAGVFSVKNVPQEHLHPLLLIECPRQLFPFARRIVADVTRDGGYPPLMLDMVDFVAIYRQELARRQAEQQTVGTA